MKNESSSSSYRQVIASWRAISACLVLLLLSAVLCPPIWAGGSWLVDGQAVQSLEVQTTNDDPAAIHTDGTRKMAAPLAFENSVSSPSAGLFKAYVPWDGTYDFFLFDEDEEALRLSNGSLGFYPTGDLYISGATVGDANGSGRVDIGESTLKGGTWMLDAVGPYDECIITRGFADNRYIRSAVSNENVSLYCYADDPQQSHKKITIRAAASGVGDVTATVDPEEGFVVDDQWGRAARISSASMRLGTGNTEIEIMGSDVYLYADATSADHALNRRTGDNRYIQRSEGITTNHTFQAGDVLQIQNGIITAINP